MGCGALCGDATSFASMPLALPQNRLKQLLPGLKNSKYFPTE